MRFLLVRGLACAVLCLTAWKVPGATLGLQTDAPERVEGAIVIPIHLQVDLTAPVASLQFDVRFDSAALTFSAVSAGPSATGASKSVHSNLLGPGHLRVVVAGLNRTAMDTGPVAFVNFTPAAPTANAVTVTMERAILSDPYGTSIPVTIAPNTVVLEGDDGTLSPSLATGSTGPVVSTDHYGNYRALILALLFVAAAMYWTKRAPKKGRRR